MEGIRHEGAHSTCGNMKTSIPDLPFIVKAASFKIKASLLACNIFISFSFVKRTMEY
jgi:hypothetical protein